MPGKNLTRDEATARAAVIAVDHYDVALDLTTSDTTFRSTTTVTFTSAEPGADDLRRPHRRRPSRRSRSTATPLDPATHFDGVRVRVPATAEQQHAHGRRHRGIHEHRRGAAPLRRPGRRRGLPLLAVRGGRLPPDVRGLRAARPQGDLRVHRDRARPTGRSCPTPPRPSRRRRVRRRRRTWAFAPTARMSCYITALVAGPYAVVRDEVQTRRGTVPLGIFCRQSLLEHLDADNVFDCTKLGFAFFEEEFDCEYPFEKYDQLFTPEYNMGAMENAGAVTISEIYVFRSKVTEALVERRALTLLHELAHMWFGNLVTMKWWNDLWLNESFAEWASTTCQAEATEWTERLDDLRHLREVLGLPPGPALLDPPDRRRRSATSRTSRSTSTASPTPRAPRCSSSWSPTSAASRSPPACGPTSPSTPGATPRLDDLLRELEATSGRDLGTWSKLWLETAGVNTLRPEIETDDQGLISSARIVQTYAEGFETLRPHRLAVGLYDVDAPTVARWSAPTGSSSTSTGSRTDLPQLVGRQRPTCCSSTTTTSPTPRSASTSARSRPPWRTRAASRTACPAPWCSAPPWDMTRDAEMSAPRLRRRSSSPRCPARPTRPCCACSWASCRRRCTSMSHPSTARRRSRAPPATCGSSPWPPSPAATPSSSWSVRMPRTSAVATTRHTCAACSTARRCSTASPSTPTCAGRCSPRSPPVARRRRPTSTPSWRATTRPPGASAPSRPAPSFPTAEAKAEAWRRGVEETGLPNSIARGGRRRLRDRARHRRCCEPYVEKYHAMLDTVEGKAVARHHRDPGPRLLPHGRWPTSELHDATAGLADGAPRRARGPAPPGRREPRPDRPRPARPAA